jgi:phytoene dehydrogenase-like protein
VHLAFHAAVCSYTTDVPGLAIGFPLLVGKINNWHLCLGGSHRLAHALWRDLAQHGGVMISDAEVSSIMVDGGRAVGVTLASGEQITARQAVVSTVDVEQTFLKFLEPGAVDPELRHKVEHNIAHKDWSLFSVHAAMNRLPEYEAAAFDPDVNRAWVVNLGYNSPAELNEDWRQIRAGKVPDPRPNAAVNSLYDPTDAPEGYYTGLLRQFAPFEVNGAGAGEWDSMGRWYGSRCLEAWQRFAPNLTEDAFLDWAPFTPFDIERKMPNMRRGDWMMGEISLDNMLDQRPLPELGQYRTPIDGLYMGGSTQHPHGFITFGPGYNALQVIAEDLGIDPWWRQI